MADSQNSNPRTTLPEHSLVRVTRDVGLIVGDFPAGTVGTVVHVYPDGLAYEVEFNRCWTGEPEDDWRECVVTVDADDLEAAE